MLAVGGGVDWAPASLAQLILIGLNWIRGAASSGGLRQAESLGTLVFN